MHRREVQELPQIARVGGGRVRGNTALAGEMREPVTRLHCQLRTGGRKLGQGACRLRGTRDDHA